MQPMVSQASTRMSTEHEQGGPLRAFDTTSVILGPEDASTLRAVAIGGPEEAISRCYFVHVSRGIGGDECMRPSSCLQVRATETGRTAACCSAF